MLCRLKVVPEDAMKVQGRYVGTRGEKSSLAKHTGHALYILQAITQTTAASFHSDSLYLSPLHSLHISLLLVPVEAETSDGTH